MLSERGVFRRMDPSGQDATDNEIMENQHCGEVCGEGDGSTWSYCEMSLWQCPAGT